MTEVSTGGPERESLPQLPPPTLFERVPKNLNIEVVVGRNVSHCGVVMGDNGQPVLVAVFRRKDDLNEPYQAPILGYLKDELSGHPNVVRANLQWRLPESETELRELMSGLVKS